MNFFKWLRWVFSKQLKVKFENSVFIDMTDDFLYKKNGVFYVYNVRYEFIDCIFKEREEPKPNVVDVKIDMTPMGYNEYYDAYYDSYIGKSYKDKFIIPSKEPLPFSIVVLPEPILSKEEQEINRTNRFVDAIKNWEKRNDRLAKIEN